MVIKEVDAEKQNMNADDVEVKKSDFAENTDRVGSILCHERLKKGLELEDVSQVLCIRSVYLEAIESGNYVELPSLPYSAGFVNSYAKYLGLNNNRITQLFREELNDDPKEKRFFPAEDMAAEASLPDKRYIIGGIAALFFIGGLWSGLHSTDTEVETQPVTAAEKAAGEVEYFSPSSDEGEAVLPEGEGTPTGENAEAVVSADAEQPAEQIVMKNESFIAPQTEGASPSAAADEKNVEGKETPAQVEIKIGKDDTWVEVRDAKKVYFNKVMRPGESYRVPEGKGMILSAGKYNGVEVYINGKLTPVIQPNKKMNVPLDPFIESAEH